MKRLCLGGALAFAGAPLFASGIETTYPAHSRAVDLARAGHHDEGLAILRELLLRFPDDYPLNRDYIVISQWKGACDQALAHFARIQDRPQLDDYLIAAVADCAVQRARAGDHDAGLEVLTRLLPQVADPYALRRDITLVTIWTGDCERALEWFDPIRDDPRHEPYLVVPVSDCLLERDRATEAVALTEAALARRPDEPALRHAYAKAEVALAVDRGVVEGRPIVEAALVTDEADRGPREWLLRAEASDAIARRARVYARYLGSWAGDPDFDAGEMNRAGLGVRWRPTARWQLVQEFSRDVSASGLGGSHTLLAYRPYDTWRLVAGYHTYAEDIALAARAAGIEADRADASVEYNSLDYVWHWRASASRYDFSDTNRRTSAYSTLGYAYQMLPEREHRIYGEVYASRNTLDNAVYFNPSEDRSLGVVHRTDFVFDSRFRRHVDRLYFTAASYWQEGFGAEPKWGVKYEQDYELDGARTLVAGVAYDSNVYDGERESEWLFEVYYRRRF
jgi:hypothetical protein